MAKSKLNIAPALKVTAASAKYTGYEPEFIDIAEDSRKVEKMRAFNWYNYHYGPKEVLSLIADWLKAQDRMESYKYWKKVAPGTVPNAVGWLARMNLRGWEFDELEDQQVGDAIAEAIAPVKLKKEEPKVEDEADAKPKGPTIQDRMREKAAEAGGELEGMLDEFLAAGCPTKHKFQPIGKLKLANILPQHVPAMAEHWDKVRSEWQEAYEGKDDQLKEAYGHLNKIQLRNLVKFATMMIEDLNSYVTFKKATKAPRKRKQKTPEQLAVKLKWLREYPELDLKSVRASKIVGAKEMFVYSTKKRKLMYFIADPHAGDSLSIKNNTITGFDLNKTVAKTLRKPKEQLKKLMAASKPNTRKQFAEVKAVETKLSGRFADDFIILKVF